MDSPVLSLEKRKFLSRFSNSISPHISDVEQFLDQIPVKHQLEILNTTTDIDLVNDLLNAIEHLCRFPQVRLSLWNSQEIPQLLAVACESIHPFIRSFAAQRLESDYKNLPSAVQYELKTPILHSLCKLALDVDGGTAELALNCVTRVVSLGVFGLPEILDVVEEIIKKSKVNIIKEQAVCVIRLASMSPAALKLINERGLLNVVPPIVCSTDENSDLLLQLVVFQLVLEMLEFPEAFMWLKESHILDYALTSLCEARYSDNTLRNGMAEVIERVLEGAPDLISKDRKSQLVKTYLRTTLTEANGDEVDLMGGLCVFSGLLFSGNQEILLQFPDVLTSVVNGAVSPRQSLPCRIASLKALELGLKMELSANNLEALYRDYVVPQVVHACKSAGQLLEFRASAYSLLLRMFTCFPVMAQQHGRDVALLERLSESSPDSEVAALQVKLRNLLSKKNEQRRGIDV